MTKAFKPGRQAVELRPSRIRRDPVRIDTKVKPESPEREVRTVVIGVVLFGAAIAAAIVGISDVTNGNAREPVRSGQFGHCYNQAGADCVVDGDTIYLAGARVEIAGLDAPRIQGARCERERDRGIEAAGRLLELLNSGQVSVAGGETGADGQLLSKIAVDGRDIGAAMVSAGVAREEGGGQSGWC